MGVSRCRVSYTDVDGVVHAVDVDSESLYEAVAMAFAEWRNDEMIPQLPGPMTELTVTVIRRPVEHKVRLGQVQGTEMGAAVRCRWSSGYREA